jgi:hypothetical protein
MYADAALAADDAARVEWHATTCAACRTRIAALRRENEVLRTALQEVDEAAPIPRFTKPTNFRDLLVLVLGVALIGGFSMTFWSALGASVPSALRWLNPFEVSDLGQRAIEFFTFVFTEGTAMWTATLNTVGAALVVALAGWVAIAAARRRGFAAVAASILAVVIALPSIGHALERRTGGVITVAAGETIDDSLFAAGQSIEIDGNINGDLLAFAQTVTVRGNVAGNIFTGGQEVNIEGTVGGSIIGGAQDLTLARARVARNLFGFGNDVDVDGDAEITGNAIAFGESVGLEGRVGRDVIGGGSRVTIGGTVEGDVEGFASSMRLLPTARITGDVTAHVDTVGDLNVADGAVVGGNTTEDLFERGPFEQRVRRNPYYTFGFYVSQVVRLGAAFVTGLVLLWLFPALRDVTLPTVVAVLRSGGIGLAAMVTLPVAAFLVCLTVVGLPVGILTFILGAIGLYLSKTVLAFVIGRSLFRDPANPPHYAVALLAGLAIVIVAINIPVIGGLASFLLTIVGFGIIVTMVFTRLNRGATL